MRERIAELMQRLATALESPACRDFDELVARALPAIRGSRDIALLDVEAQHQPPRILLATGNGWRLVIDLEGIRAWKHDLLSLGVADDGIGQAAVQRRFARPDDDTAAVDQRGVS